MKTLKTLLLAGILTLFLLPASSSAHVRVYVRVGPPPPKYVKVVKHRKPHRDAFWVSGHWKWNGHRYVWVRGHWVRPRRGYVYVAGHWVRTYRGWRWVDGHWRQR